MGCSEPPPVIGLQNIDMHTMEKFMWALDAKMIAH